MKAAAVRYTTCEKDFVLKAIESGIRLDGRQSYDYRNIEIEFGLDYGCCEVKIGDTRVLAQTSAEMVKPVDTRPTEGQLYLNVDLSPMASPAFENGRSSNQGVEINRMVERCLKESRPIDVESLCVIAGEKVWSIRVDILVLNDCGNILDCACIAAICSLAHFKRPDVTVTGSEVTIVCLSHLRGRNNGWLSPYKKDISECYTLKCLSSEHSLEEKDPLPLNIHHMPICTTFGFLDEGKHVIIDPEEKEESIIAGQMTLSFNIHGELCCSQMSGGVALDLEQILQCAKIASVKAVEITELIKEGLEEDKQRRAPPKTVKREGLKDPIHNPTAPTIMKTIAEPSSVDMESVSEETREFEKPSADSIPVDRLGTGTVGIGEGGKSTWLISDNSEEEEEDEDGDKLKKKPVTIKQQHKQNNIMDVEEILDDSEEEETFTLGANDEFSKNHKDKEVLVPTVLNENNNSSDTTSETKKKKKKKKKIKNNKNGLG